MKMGIRLILLRGNLFLLEPVDIPMTQAVSYSQKFLNEPEIRHHLKAGHFQNKLSPEPTRTPSESIQSFRALFESRFDGKGQKTRFRMDFARLDSPFAAHRILSMLFIGWNRCRNYFCNDADAAIQQQVENLQVGASQLIGLPNNTDIEGVFVGDANGDGYADILVTLSDRSGRLFLQDHPDSTREWNRPKTSKGGSYL